MGFSLCPSGPWDNFVTTGKTDTEEADPGRAEREQVVNGGLRTRGISKWHSVAGSHAGQILMGLGVSREMHDCRPWVCTLINRGGGGRRRKGKFKPCRPFAPSHIPC